MLVIREEPALGLFGELPDPRSVLNKLLLKTIDGIFKYGPHKGDFSTGAFPAHGTVVELLRQYRLGGEQVTR